MRALHKLWKTPRGGFTHRIRWYQGAEASDIRLSIETPDGARNVFPKDRDEADGIWAQFRAEHA
jgi:hypothetical protein